MLTTSAAHYLIPPPKYFWRWDKEDHAAVWAADGGTMAFARELIPLMAELAGEIGLPPLGAMLMVLVVAKQLERWGDLWEKVWAFSLTLGVENAVPKTIQRFEPGIRRGLQMVASLPGHLREGQGARLHLLRTLFASTFNRLPVDLSAQIVDEFRAEPAGDLKGQHDMSGLTRLLRDCKALHAAFDNVTEEALHNSLLTGVKFISFEDEEEAENPLPPRPRQADGLWSDLEQSPDDEMRAVASFARQLLAVIHLPRPLHHHDDQPVGGVSDIANKGDPARLLLSELAHDEDTLAVRLAFNEALYLRRETPPAAPLPSRCLLLDNSILLWGRARLYATAAALALHKPRQGKEQVELRGHRHPTFEPLPMAGTADLRAWWARPDPAPDCRHALDQALLELLADKPEAQPEIVLITHRDAAALLAPMLNKRGWPPGARFFIITVTGEGRCVLHQRSQAGSKEISAAQLEPPKALLGG